MGLPITVIIPTHDRRELLVMAVASALEQTRPPLQVIVVADGCTDGTAEAVRGLGDPRAEVLELPKGPGYAYGHRNEALRLARGAVVAWLGDDDLWLPEHLERAGELFDAELAEIVTTVACIVHEDDRLEATWMDWGVPQYRDRLFAGENRTPSSAVACCVPAALDVDGFRPELSRAGDLDLWQRMIAAGARTSLLSAPTVLHFRATTREQGYADRLRQTATFLDRLRDPLELTRLRAAMERKIQARYAELEEAAVGAVKAMQVAIDERDALVDASGQRPGALRLPGRLRG